MNSIRKVTLTLTGAAGGLVTRSRAIMELVCTEKIGSDGDGVGHINSQVREKVARTVVDAGRPMGAADEKLYWATRHLHKTRDRVHAIVTTHNHADHVGGLVEESKENPDTPIYVIAETKRVLGRALTDCLGITLRRQNRPTSLSKKDELLLHLEALRKLRNASNTAKKKERLPKVKRRPPQIQRNRKGRKEATTRLEDIVANKRGEKTMPRRKIREIARLPEDAESIHWDTACSILGDEYIPCGNSFEDLEHAIYEYIEDTEMLDILQERIDQKDLQNTINRTQEVPMNQWLPLFGETSPYGDVDFLFSDSGHLVAYTAGQLSFRIGVEQDSGTGENNQGQETKIVHFSGDLGRTDLPDYYPKPDTGHLAGKVDYLVLESTYGDRFHNPYEQEMARMERLILEAFQRGEDIIIPSISLDRPVIMLYEIITRLIDTGKIPEESIDICIYGPLILHYLELVPKNHPMWRVIRGRYRRLVSKELGCLQKKGSIPKIVIAGGAFLKEGCPACKALDQAFCQKNLTVIIANYAGGAESTARKLINRQPVPLTIDNQDQHLGEGHKIEHITGLSRHADQKQLIEYVLKVMKPGGTVLLNHGSDVARMALREALLADPRVQDLNLTIILAELEKPYTLN